ncbi:MAG: hypothetical protein CEN87_270, partial [Parcubacteria group bacterium Licking1014_1]
FAMHFGERAKNGGVLGEEIFCLRADEFSCPPRQLAGRAETKTKFARAQKIPLGRGAKGNFLRPRRCPKNFGKYF